MCSSLEKTLTNKLEKCMCFGLVATTQWDQKPNQQQQKESRANETVLLIEHIKKTKGHRHKQPVHSGLNVTVGGFVAMQKTLNCDQDY